MPRAQSTQLKHMESVILFGQLRTEWHEGDHIFDPQTNVQLIQKDTSQIFQKFHKNVYVHAFSLFCQPTTNKKTVKQTWKIPGSFTFWQGK